MAEIAADAVVIVDAAVTEAEIGVVAATAADEAAVVDTEIAVLGTIEARATVDPAIADREMVDLAMAARRLHRSRKPPALPKSPTSFPARKSRETTKR